MALNNQIVIASMSMTGTVSSDGRSTATTVGFDTGAADGSAGTTSSAAPISSASSVRSVATIAQPYSTTDSATNVL